MNSDLEKLHPYPFEKLARLKAGVSPPPGLPHIALSIGEPRHPSPQLVIDALVEALDGLAHYPTTKGLAELRQAISNWASRRFGLAQGSLNPDSCVLPVNGTREAIFALAQAVISRADAPLVVMPNPFYQIYEGAALLAGAEPYYLNCTADNAFLPDYDAVPEKVWKHCQLLYVCSPGNPTGAVQDLATYQYLIELADEHDFIIASDECYSEIYLDEEHPPPGLLGACAAMGRDDYRRCIVFHSLSKRSNLPGLRSGFVAGDANVLGEFLRYRTYHGCAMSLQNQHASIAAWNDEAHVQLNRALYREKFTEFMAELDGCLRFPTPRASFYLWPQTPWEDDQFTQDLYARQNVTVTPGRYLSREFDGIDPGRDRIRIALVEPLDECIAAAQRIRQLVRSD